jgi:hypothetical protein
MTTELSTWDPPAPSVASLWVSGSVSGLEIELQRRWFDEDQVTWSPSSQGSARNYVRNSPLTPLPVPGLTRATSGDFQVLIPRQSWRRPQ